MKGKKHTQKTKNKISRSKKGQNFWSGKKHTKESKIKMSKSALGKIITQETKNKISKSNSGKKRTENQKINYANSKKGENNSRVKLTWIKVREIRKLYKKGNISQYKISLIYNVTRSTIQQIINNKNWVE